MVSQTNEQAIETCTERSLVESSRYEKATWLTLTATLPSIAEGLALPGNDLTRRTGEAKRSPQLAMAHPRTARSQDQKKTAPSLC